MFKVLREQYVVLFMLKKTEIIVRNSTIYYEYMYQNKMIKQIIYAVYMSSFSQQVRIFSIWWRDIDIILVRNTLLHKISIL